MPAKIIETHNVGVYNTHTHNPTWPTRTKGFVVQDESYPDLFVTVPYGKQENMPTRAQALANAEFLQCNWD